MDETTAGIRSNNTKFNICKYHDFQQICVFPKKSNNIINLNIMNIEYKKKIDKDSSIKIKGNPKKKSIGLWFTKSF